MSTNEHGINEIRVRGRLRSLEVRNLIAGGVVDTRTRQLFILFDFTVVQFRLVPENVIKIFQNSKVYHVK